MVVLRTFCLALVVIAATATAASGHVFRYFAFLTGDQEVPPNDSTGFGTALVTTDLDLVTMRVQINFSNLIGITSGAHIHAPSDSAGFGVAIVATQADTFPGFPTNVQAGSYDQTFSLALASTYNPAFVNTYGGGTISGALNALIAWLNQKRAYVNIHTSENGGAGEIRGFLVNLPGDFNNDGFVDAADYTVWRDTLTMADEGLFADTDNNNVIDEADYNVWLQNFGHVALVGGGSGDGAGESVPEPSAIAIALAGVSAFCACRRRR